MRWQGCARGLWRGATACCCCCCLSPQQCQGLPHSPSCCQAVHSHSDGIQQWQVVEAQGSQVARVWRAPPPTPATALWHPQHQLHSLGVGPEQVCQGDVGSVSAILCAGSGGGGGGGGGSGGGAGALASGQGGRGRGGLHAPQGLPKQPHPCCWDAEELWQGSAAGAGGAGGALPRGCLHHLHSQVPQGGGGGQGHAWHPLAGAGALCCCLQLAEEGVQGAWQGQAAGVARLALGGRQGDAGVQGGSSSLQGCQGGGQALQVGQPRAVGAPQRQQAQPGLLHSSLRRLPLLQLVAQARQHEGVAVAPSLLHQVQGQGLQGQQAQPAQVGRGKVLALLDLPLQVPALVQQVLQGQVPHVSLGAGRGHHATGLLHALAGAAVGLLKVH